MNNLKQILGISLVSWFLFLILGFFLFFRAEMTLLIISYMIGFTLLISGIIPFIKNIMSKENSYFNLTFITSIFSMVAGLIIILNNRLIVSIIPLFIGIVLIINGIYKIQIAAFLKSQNYTKWFLNLIFAIIIIACGMIFVINPFSGAKAITEIIGIFIIAYTIFDIISYFFLRKTMKNINVYENDNIKIIEINDEK